jgi:hypothetical protein
MEPTGTLGDQLYRDEVSADTRAENRRHDLSEPSDELAFAAAPKAGEALAGLLHRLLNKVRRIDFGLESSADFDLCQQTLAAAAPFRQ